MPQLTLIDALRYFFAPCVLFSYFVFYDRSYVVDLNKDFVGVGTVAFLVAGTIIYFVYRYLIYDPIILWLHDVFRKNSWRRFFGDRYILTNGNWWTPTCTLRALRLYYEMSIGENKFQSEPLRVRASAIHLLYQAGLLAIPFFLFSACNGSNLQRIFFGGVSFIFLITAILADKNYEEQEYVFLKSKIVELDPAANRLGLEKRVAGDSSRQSR
jgi:hypothetical protein